MVYAVAELRYGVVVRKNGFKHGYIFAQTTLRYMFAIFCDSSRLLPAAPEKTNTYTPRSSDEIQPAEQNEGGPREREGVDDGSGVGGCGFLGVSRCSEPQRS